MWESIKMWATMVFLLPIAWLFWVFVVPVVFMYDYFFHINHDAIKIFKHIHVKEMPYETPIPIQDVNARSESPLHQRQM